MIRLPILFLFTFFAITSKAQIIENRVEKYIVEQSIDSFIIYSFQCDGNFFPDSCQSDAPQYLFWKEDGNYYLKRFDYCKTYKYVLLDTINPFNFYLRNRKAIEREHIKQPTYFEVRKIKGIEEKVIITSIIDHTCYHNFAVPVLGKLKNTYASIFDLDFKVFDNGKKNIYYNYNQATKFKSLIDLTTTLIEKMNTSNKFQSD